MNFEELKWDSDFFSRRIAKVYVDTVITDLHQLNAVGFDIIYIFSKVRQPILENQNVLLMDTKVNYKKKISTINNSKVDNVISYHGDSNEQLIKLALQSGWKSRFKMDTNLNNKYDELYLIWLRKSLDRSIADDFFVTLENEAITGFVTVVKSEGGGAIGLIAVDENYRGKGLGSKLIIRAELWCAENKLSALNVVTQLDNESACMLYEKNHYKITSTDFIYHFSKL